MKLEKLKIFESLLIEELTEDEIRCELFFKKNKTWHSSNETEIETEATLLELNSSTTKKISHHTPESLTAWFYLPDLSATVSLHFQKPPITQARKKLRLRIDRVNKNSSNAYKVSHHSLTHLLAKDTFREKLSSAIIEISNIPTSSAEIQDSEQAKTLAVFALDIDHFKQINDTWGHLYGDQVLKIFGRRLEEKALTLVATSEKNPTIHIGHPSGEEFLILITANATREEFGHWANEFRSAISDEILPSENEWTWLANRDNLKTITPPSITDRTVSTSIGIALLTNISKFDNGDDPSASLLDRADTALYRAKAAGRNQFIFYDDILSSCGRVLEHDLSTDIIAIDIGSNVGVEIGQEFKVFHPKFIGKTKFSVNDGRTTRTLGLYPRIENARLIVFDTQAEISFAYIADPQTTKLVIELGSHLEAIPAGSIGHLLPNASKYFPAISKNLKDGGFESIQDFVRSAIKDKADPFAIVVKFTNEPEYLKKYGTAALNAALAKLYRTARASFHSLRVIEVIDRSSICIAGPNKLYKEKTVTDFINETSQELPELGVMAGVFCKADYKSSSNDGPLEIDPHNAIELARFSSSDIGRDENNRIRHFAHSVAMKILISLRDSQSLETAHADFKRLIDFDITTSSIYNLGGLIADGLGFREEALKHFEHAILKNGSNPILKTNYGTTALEKNETDTALKYLNTLTSDELDSIKEIHPFGYFVYATLLAKAKNADSSYYIESKLKEIGRTALTLGIAQKRPISSKIILDALENKLPTDK